MTATVLSDKIRLFLTAAGVAIALILSAVVFREYIPISKGWRFFVGGSVVYTITALYLFFRSAHYSRKGVSRKISTFLITKLFLLELPVFIFFLLFYFETLSLPEYMWPYWLVSLILAPLMLEIVKRMDGSG